MEKAQNLEVSMLCDRETTRIAGGQSGFIQFVVMPIFQQLSNIATDINNLQLENGTKNIEKWKVRAVAEQKQQDKEKAMKALIAKNSEKQSFGLSIKDDETNKLKADNKLDSSSSDENIEPKKVI